MKQLLVISGKGGTGKTTMVSSFAFLAKNKTIADCDVDASDLHLILEPEVRKRENFTSQVAVKDDSICTECGLCYEKCRFDAIDENYNIDPLRCEGCGVCAYVCPEDAIEMENEISGEYFLSDTKCGSMVHARLEPGGENSGQLVTAVKREAGEVASKEGKDLILIDGSPGTGCPVIASLANVDLALIVAEPTLSGVHDLKRILGVAEQFGVTSLICINKFDLNLENTEDIEEFARSKGIEVVGKIPYNNEVTEAMVQGKSVVENPDGEVKKAIENTWERIENRLEED